MTIVSTLKEWGYPVRTRKDWGTVYEDLYQKRRTARPTANFPLSYQYFHITVTFDDGELTGDFDRDMRELERIGYLRFGTGISYTFVVDAETGMIGEGHPVDAAGAHTINDKNVAGFPINLNKHGIAIAMLGMPGVQPTHYYRESCAAILRASWDEGVTKNEAPSYPHSFFAFKECPTTAVRVILPTIQQMAKEMVMPLTNEDKKWLLDSIRTIVKEPNTVNAIAKAVKEEIPDLQIANIRTEIPGDTIGMNTMLRDIYRDTDDIKKLIRAHHVEPAQDLPPE